VVCSLGRSHSPGAFSKLDSGGFDGGFDGACGGFKVTLLHVVGEDSDDGAALECGPEILALHDFTALAVDVGEAGNLALLDGLLDVHAQPRQAKLEGVNAHGAGGHDPYGGVLDDHLPGRQAGPGGHGLLFLGGRLQRWRLHLAGGQALR
jgi:hypothetical protein